MDARNAQGHGSSRPSIDFASQFSEGQVANVILRIYPNEYEVCCLRSEISLFACDEAKRRSPSKNHYRYPDPFFVNPFAVRCEHDLTSADHVPYFSTSNPYRVLCSGNPFADNDPTNPAPLVTARTSHSTARVPAKDFESNL